MQECTFTTGRAYCGQLIIIIVIVNVAVVDDVKRQFYNIFLKRYCASKISANIAFQRLILQTKQGPTSNRTKVPTIVLTL